MSKKKSKNSHIWSCYGVISTSQMVMDELMPLALAVIEQSIKAGLSKEEIFDVLMKEAWFQLGELPTRTKAFQKSQKWTPP